ncbi:MAG: molybdate ABC transporter substrate-binding protein [Rhodobacterales bacterium]|nr:MAG: molybdate ABC transporter substrate-binding protein [Rhodobacterales bacterium]
MLRILALTVLFSPFRVWAAEDRVIVFAAASLGTVLEELAGLSPVEVVISAGGSAVMARQIDQGAPAGVVILAHPVWMDWLEKMGAIQSGSRRDLLANRLVVVAPKQSAPLVASDIAGRLGPGGRLAVGQVRSVPAGIYARAWAEAEGVWGDLRDRLAETENVRAALALVARGEAPLGVVYASDAMAEPMVEVVYDIPETAHPPIRYPAALVADAGPAADAFLDFLGSDQAAQVFAAHGFEPLPLPEEAGQ